MQIEEKQKWTRERILSEIMNSSVDGYCKTINQTLATVARRMFGTWESACHAAGVKSYKERSLFSICSVENCSSIVRHQRCQWCEKHYYRNRRNGHPEKLFLKQYSVDENFFDTWSPDMAWLVGLLWSDGWMNGNTIGIKSKDEQLINDVKTVLATNVATKVECGKYYRITISSKHMSNTLRCLGMCEAKSLIIDWPNKIPVELQWHFIRGLLDGDGCVLLKKYRNGQIAKDCHLKFSTASERLNNSFIAKINVPYSLQIREPFLLKSGKWSSRFFTVTIYEQSSLKYIIEQMYPDKEVPCLHRKRDLLWEFYTTPRQSAGNPVLRARRIGRICAMCSQVFSTTLGSDKVCCTASCGRRQAWKTRHKKGLPH